MKNFQEFKERVGEVLKRRRKEKGRSQAELADQVGLNQADISRIERGEQGFDSATIFKLAAALESSLADIFSEVEQPTAGGRLPPEAIAFGRVWMQLPPDMREDYKRRIEALAHALGHPVPDEKSRGKSQRNNPHRPPHRPNR